MRKAGGLLLLVPSVLAACGTATHSTHSTHKGDRSPDGHRQVVRVDADLSAVPVGTIVHLCLRDSPCVTDRTTYGNRSGGHFIDIPLPAGVSARDADGWPLRVYAAAHGQHFAAKTRVVYHVSVDPPCRCAGDYALLNLALVGGRQ